VGILNEESDSFCEKLEEFSRAGQPFDPKFDVETGTQDEEK
jgi:hypothetical protein